MMLEGVLLMTMAAAPVPTQDWVDLERYAGRWYEIARLPNRFQERCAGDVAEPTPCVPTAGSKW
jgi:lipocalin